MGRARARDAVVVVTGASSGIGRATARAFARRGATVVVTARREEALHEVVTECERAGGRALAVPADVTDEEQVSAVAKAALDHFGRLDVWVNDAGVSLFARFEEAPSDAFRRVFETNFFGTVHGARAALRAFREQGRGVLINVSSMVGKAAAPYLSAYVASKFAIVGLSESLRQELRDAPEIHVCTVLPASIDTPIFQHAANFSGRAVKPLEPVIDVDRVAEAIARLAERPRREVLVGRSGARGVLLHSLAPRVAERKMASKVERDHFADRAAAPSRGNLFAPMPEWTGASGGWKRGDGSRAPTLRTAALALLAIAAPAYAGWRWARG